MITNIIIYAAMTPFILLWSFLPEPNTAFADILSTIQGVLTPIMGYSWLFPVSTIFSVGLAIIAVEVVLFLVYSVNKLIKLLPDWISGN